MIVGATLVDAFLTPAHQTRVRFAWLFQNQVNKVLAAVVQQYITFRGFQEMEVLSVPFQTVERTLCLMKGY